MDTYIKIQTFKDLNTWKEGHKLVLAIYKATNKFPHEEKYGLTDQMRRAAVSITSNIAEGFSRRSSKEKAQFYSMAQGSNTELQNHIVIARDLSYIDNDLFNTIDNQLIVVHKLLNGLIKHSRLFFHSS